MKSGTTEQSLVVDPGFPLRSNPGYACCRQIDRLNVSIVGPKIGRMKYTRVSTSDHGPTLRQDALKAANRARMVAGNGMFVPEAL